MNAALFHEQSIAFSDGEDVHFANAAKFKLVPGRVCRRGHRGRSDGDGGGDGAMVTALAFDAVSTGVLYVGFGTGEVMVSVLAVVCGYALNESTRFAGETTTPRWTGTPRLVVLVFITLRRFGALYS